MMYTTTMTLFTRKYGTHIWGFINSIRAVGKQSFLVVCFVPLNLQTHFPRANLFANYIIFVAILGIFVGPLVLGRITDITKSYTITIRTVGCIFFVASAIMAFVKPAVDRHPLGAKVDSKNQVSLLTVSNV